VSVQGFYSCYIAVHWISLRSYPHPTGEKAVRIPAIVICSKILRPDKKGNPPEMRSLFLLLHFAISETRECYIFRRFVTARASY